MAGRLEPPHSISSVTAARPFATASARSAEIRIVWQARRKPGELKAYIELHIEQGAILDESEIDIGVVEGIVGIRWWDVTIEGVPNHAGTTPMNRRRDAMLSAAEFALAVNRVATTMPGRRSRPSAGSGRNPARRT